MAVTTPRRIDVALAARVRPTSDRRDQVVPVVPALGAVVPGGGMTRGGVVVVEPGPAGAEAAGGATTLAFSLLAAATTGGAWCGAVGVNDVGILAVAELGVDLDRLLLVRGAGQHWAEVAAGLVDGLDVVVVCPPGPVRPAAARRLVARARERRSVLVVLARHAPWSEGPDLRLTVTSGQWVGVGHGHGHLRGRRVELVTAGRRAASRPTRATVWLPGRSGT
ncbi:MAG TPA: hypothetical protein VKR22_14790, partial [Acidimicrobiales bacterium]|nr:hypothetical protein [Acidimicrobiales bacterium]